MTLISISHCHSFPHVNDLLTLLHSDTNTRLPHYAKTFLPTPELQTPMPGHPLVWVCFSPGSASLCLPSTPESSLRPSWAPASSAPSRHASFLPCSGFDTLCQATFLWEHPPHLYWVLTPHSRSPPAWRPSSLCSCSTVCASCTWAPTPQVELPC